MDRFRNIGVVLLFFFLLGLVLNSCKTQKELSSDGFQNEFMGIKGIKCAETLSPNAIDSKVGTIKCEGITFNYDYGKFSNPGPLTAKEEFSRSFNTYHHIKFFEYRMLDPKVYKIFLDSVEVVEVRSKNRSDDHFFECKPCNATAVLTFKGDTYYYPLTISESQLNSKGFSATFEEKEGMIYKYYKAENSNTGLYIAPKKNTFKKKNTLSLVVSDTSLTIEKVDAILKNVYLKNNS